MFQEHLKMLANGSQMTLLNSGRKTLLTSGLKIYQKRFFRLGSGSNKLLSMSTKDLKMQLNGSAEVIPGKQLLPHLLHQSAFFTRANSRKAGICSPTQKPTWASI